MLSLLTPEALVLWRQVHLHLSVIPVAPALPPGVGSSWCEESNLSPPASPALPLLPTSNSRKLRAGRRGNGRGFYASKTVQAASVISTHGLADARPIQCTVAAQQPERPFSAFSRPQTRIHLLSSEPAVRGRARGSCKACRLCHWPDRCPRAAVSSVGSG